MNTDLHININDEMSIILIKYFESNRKHINELLYKIGYHVYETCIIYDYLDNFLSMSRL